MADAPSVLSSPFFLSFSSFLDHECRASWLLTASCTLTLAFTDLMMHLFHSIALKRLHLMRLCLVLRLFEVPFQCSMRVV